jgi:hypothetical protein
MNTLKAPTAADFMSDELFSKYGYYDYSSDCDDSSDCDSNYSSDFDYDSDESYDSFNSTKMFDMKEHFRSLEIKRLRLFIQGKYEMEEGEILSAFEACSDDDQIACELAIAYIKTLDGFQNAYDLSEFILDTVDDLKLNSAQALNIHAVLLSEKINQKFCIL